MKRLLSIGLLLSLLVACTPKGDDGFVATRHGTSLPTTSSPELAAVDSLLWRQPDSALAMLLPCFDTCCRDAMIASPETPDGDFIETHAMRLYNRHYANLLLAELLYKNYYAQTNRAELLQAVGYFDSLVREAPPLKRGLGGLKTTQSPTQPDIIAFLSARAHYINGVGYYEHDCVVPACKGYMKALEVMEEHFKEKELVGKKAQFMALTYTHLTGLFSDLYLHEQAIYFGKESIHYYKKYNVSPHYIAWVLNNIGSHYDIMNEFDSAYYYYSQGLHCIQDTNSLTYRGIATHLAFLSYKTGTPSNHSLNQLHKLITQSENNVEYVSRCLTIGEIYYHEHQLDSANYYLEIVYDQTKSVDARKQAAEWLAEIAKAQGRKAEALEYASFLVPFATMGENQSGIKSQLTALYNEYKHARLAHHEHKEAQKRIRLGWSIGSIMLLVIFFFVLRNVKHKKILESERHTHKMQQAALAGRLRHSNANLKEQEKKQIFASAPSSVQHQNSTKKYVDEPICKHILSVCNDKSNVIKSTVPISAYASIALSDIQKAQLKDAAMRHYGQLFEKMKRLHPELKGKDFLYCYLCLLGLDNVQISVLLQNSISTIWDRENRLKKIFGSKDKVSVILFGFINNI